MVFRLKKSYCTFAMPAQPMPRPRCPAHASTGLLKKIRAGHHGVPSERGDHHCNLSRLVETRVSLGWLARAGTGSVGRGRWFWIEVNLAEPFGSFLSVVVNQVLDTCRGQNGWIHCFLSLERRGASGRR